MTSETIEETAISPAPGEGAQPKATKKAKGPKPGAKGAKAKESTEQNTWSALPGAIGRPAPSRSTPSGTCSS